MTISKQERAEWRKRLNAPYSDPCREASEMRNFSLRLLDILEAAEARAEELQHQVFEHEHNANFAEGVANSALARAEAAERGWSALITPLLLVRCCPDKDISACIQNGFTAHKETGRCRLCWLEWARQQARGGENA